MQTDGKIAVLVTKEKNGGCSVDDVKKAYADLGFNDRQCRELLRHVKWLAKNATDTEEGSSATQEGGK